MSIIRSLFVLSMAALLAACGFQLRGSQPLPFATLYLSLAPTSEFYGQIRRSVEAASATQVVADIKEAEARLIVLGDISQKNILSLSAAGRAREFQLVRTFSFKVTGPDNVEYLPASSITVRRDITFSDDLVLSKESEEALLWRDMQSDLVQQLLRRLAAAKLKKAQED